MAIRMGNRPLLAAAVVLLCLHAHTWVLCSRPARAANDLPEHLRPKLRRPLALVYDAGREHLYVANRCGTVSTLTLPDGRVLREQTVAKELAWLAPLGSTTSDYLIGIDTSTHRLLVLRKPSEEIDALTVVLRFPTSSYPVYAVSNERGDRVYVSSLWSRRVACWSCGGMALDVKSWQKEWEQDLPFAPRVLAVAERHQVLLAADAFGGRLAVMEAYDGRLRSVREIPGHQLRGLAFVPAEDGKGTRLVVAQQMLNSLARTDDNDVHWGLLMSNDLRWLRLRQVLQPGADLYQDAHMTPLGEAGHAAADPSGLARLSDGTVVVTLGGVGEIAYGRADDYTFRRLRTGRRPTAIVGDDTSRRVFVANTLDDSVSVLDLQAEETIAIWPLGPQRPLSLSEQGELAFYDGRLSMDGWMTCHSCHLDGHTTSQLNDNLSDGGFDSPKRILSLLGVAGTEPLAWNGSSSTLQQQVQRSVQKTMRSRAPLSDSTAEALAAYLRTLKPPPGIDVARNVVERSAVSRGRQVFDQRGCADCHQPPTYTSPETYDVGLVDEHGNRRFNPPSLLGVSQRDRWLHDGRAKSLQEVLTKHRHQLAEELSAAELRDLLAFLRQL